MPTLPLSDQHFRDGPDNGHIAEMAASTRMTQRSQLVKLLVQSRREVLRAAGRRNPHIVADSAQAYP